VRTTTYWVYELTKAHLGQTSASRWKRRTSPSSASHKEKEATITLINPTHDQTYSVACSLNGGSARRRHGAHSAR